MAHAEAGGSTRRGVYASIRPRSQRELAAAAAAAAALEEEEEEREREKERERRRRRPAPGPSGLRHSTVLTDGEEGEGSSSDAGYESPRRRGSRQGSLRSKRSAGASDVILGTIPERRESYVGGSGGAGGGVAGVDKQDAPPWREVDADSRYPRPKPRISQASNGHPRTPPRAS